MRVLLTGAAGNLGRNLVPRLLERGHRLRTFDLPTPTNQSLLASFGAALETVWGDLRDPQAVMQAMRETEAVVHLGAITPPQSELEPEESRAVNVEGTQHVVAAARAQAQRPHLVFASSVAVYGREVGERLLDAESPLVASDHYSAHKIACEESVRASGSSYTILRLGISLPQRPSRGDPRWFSYLFEHALDSRVHFVHPADAAEALARSLEVPAAQGRILCVAGGAGCQITQRELLSEALSAVGLGMLPERAFGTRPLFGGWLDTLESQRVLGNYQRHSFRDFVASLRRSVGLGRFGVSLLSPFARGYVLRYSERYQRSRQP
ncbi:MAG: NAD(P)-dependent oxidoreductase [Myxococcales bacterium]